MTTTATATQDDYVDGYEDIDFRNLDGDDVHAIQLRYRLDDAKDRLVSALTACAEWNSWCSPEVELNLNTLIDDIHRAAADPCPDPNPEGDFPF